MILEANFMTGIYSYTQVLSIHIVTISLSDQLNAPYSFTSPIEHMIEIH